VYVVTSGIYYISYLLCQLEHCNTRLTRRVPLVEQELLTLPEHMCSPPVFSEVRVTRSLVLYVCFVNRFFFGAFVLFPLGIVLSVLLRYTEFDCPFGIFKLFLITLG
jgi:hypothetical protein